MEHLISFGRPFWKQEHGVAVALSLRVPQFWPALAGTWVPSFQKFNDTDTFLALVSVIMEYRRLSRSIYDSAFGEVNGVLV